MDLDALVDFYESERGIQRPSDKATQGRVWRMVRFSLEITNRRLKAIIRGSNKWLGTSLYGSVQLWRKLNEALPRFPRGQIDPNRDTVRLPCFFPSTHPANPDFCGREDVLELLATELLPLKNTATTSRTAPRQFALCGFGGIGKTEIAREFARRHRSSFDAVFWVMADEIAELDYRYQQFSLALGLEDESECKSQAVSREVAKRWLSNPRKRLSGSNGSDQADQGTPEASWLLIFDNAGDPMILADHWPQGGGCRGSILITSRDPLAKTRFTRRPSGLDLGPLTQEDSLSLFRRLTINLTESKDNTARQIYDAFGGVPLAISQMASIIRQKHITWPEFLKLWTDHEERANLYETKFDTNLVTYRHSLATVWAFEKLKPHARQLLEFISFLGPYIIIREDLLIKAFMEIPFEGFQFKKSSYFEAVSDLLHSSLIQRDENQRQIFVHRIIQDVVLATMDAPKRWSLFEQVVRLLWGDRVTDRWGIIYRHP
ncbi:P-loop containing nucleoside triphosphate hydrolase protein [Hypoxylon argillaceum]|nr:P-loop containing nucleoside triphosphate hydrolase protein [Hypoxylon argillaceum]